MDSNSNYRNKQLIVHVSNLKKSYGDKVALKDVSIHVEQGTIYGLIGSSGCGKSTLLQCLLNVLPWDEGEISILGRMKKLKTEVVPAEIGYMPQDICLHGRLTVSETLKYFGKLHNMEHSDLNQRVIDILNVMEISNLSNRRIDTLSGGQKRRTSMGIALLHRPKLLILDEPTVGMDPLLRERIWTYLTEICKVNRTTIIITTHYVEELKDANMIGVMRNGKIIAESDPKHLMASYGTEILDAAVLKLCQTQTQRSMLPTIITEKNMKTFTNPDILPRQKGLHFWKNFLHRSTKRTFAFTWITLLNYLRLPIFAFLFVIFPGFETWIGGMVVESDISFIPYGIVNQEVLNWETNCSSFKDFRGTRDNNGSTSLNLCMAVPLSCIFIQHLVDNEILRPISYQSQSEAEKGVQAGHVNGYLLIPENYSASLLERGISGHFPSNESLTGSVISLYGFDRADLLRSLMASWNMFFKFPDFLKILSDTCDFEASLSRLPLVYKKPVFGKLEDTIGTDVIPASVNAVLFMGAFIFAPYMVLQEIKTGTLLRSKMSGLRYVESAIGIILFNLLATLFASIVVYLTLWLTLTFTVNGTFLEYLILTLVGSLCASTFGLFFGLLVQSEIEVIYAGSFLTYILVVYSGTIRPEAFMTAFWRNILYYLFPTVSLVKSYRWVLNRGASLLHPEVWPGVMVALGWSLILIILCTKLQSRVRHCC